MLREQTKGRKEAENQLEPLKKRIGESEARAGSLQVNERSERALRKTRIQIQMQCITNLTFSHLIRFAPSSLACRGTGSC